jgi:hypothetical protein
VHELDQSESKERFSNLHLSSILIFDFDFDCCVYLISLGFDFLFVFLFCYLIGMAYKFHHAD